MRKSPLKGGLYHFGLVLIATSAFNWGFWRLTGVNIAERVFTGVQVPSEWVAGAVCISAVLVLWNNWVD